MNNVTILSKYTKMNKLYMIYKDKEMVLERKLRKLREQFHVLRLINVSSSLNMNQMFSVHSSKCLTLTFYFSKAIL